MIQRKIVSRWGHFLFQGMSLKYRRADGWYRSVGKGETKDRRKTGHSSHAESSPLYTTMIQMFRSGMRGVLGP